MLAFYNYIKKEAVMCISLFLAVFSAILIKPDNKYIDYIDFHTLGILLSLMLITAGMRNIGIFSRAGAWMLKKAGNIRSIAMILIMLCFVLSAVITNDVALITFVPFTIDILAAAGFEKYMIRIIALETVAANLGSMLTPIGGNPQNLYFFSERHEARSVRFTYASVFYYFSGGANRRNSDADRCGSCSNERSAGQRNDRKRIKKAFPILSISKPLL